MRSKYKELGLEIVSLEDKISHTPKQPLMAGEKKYDGTGDPFKMLLEEALMQQGYFFVHNFSNREKITFVLFGFSSPSLPSELLTQGSCLSGFQQSL
jgi:hypothetical protein